MKYLIAFLITVILILGFISLGVYSVASNNNMLKFQTIELESTSNKLKLNEIKQRALNVDLQQALQDKNVNQDKVKKLENQNNRLEDEKKLLQQQVRAKIQAKQVAQEKLEDAAKALSLSSKAYAISNECVELLKQAHVTDFINASWLIQKESGCRSNAINPESGACGIAQALPCNKLPCKLSDSICQIKWMQKYVIQRYGSWSSAVEFHKINNWY